MRFERRRESSLFYGRKDGIRILLRKWSKDRRFRWRTRRRRYRRVCKPDAASARSGVRELLFRLRSTIVPNVCRRSLCVSDGVGRRNPNLATGSLKPIFFLHQVFDLRQEPRVDGADLVDFFRREARAERVCHKQHTFGVGLVSSRRISALSSLRGLKPHKPVSKPRKAFWKLS